LQNQHLVADDVERLLHFALHIDVTAGIRPRIDERPERNLSGYRLARDRYVEDQSIEVTTRLRKAATLIDEVLRECARTGEGHIGLGGRQAKRLGTCLSVLGKLAAAAVTKPSNSASGSNVNEFAGAAGGDLSAP
jgi:hypothetical protein